MCIRDSYQVVASTLLALGEVGITDQRKFTNQLLDQGREMLLRRRISGESAISKDLFTTGLRLAEHRQLLEGEGEGLQSRRERFANETAEVLAAINHLQKAYDDIWFP